MEKVLGPCYVIPNGECISPFECVHGSGLSLAEFASIIADEAVHKERTRVMAEAKAKVPSV